MTNYTNSPGMPVPRSRELVARVIDATAKVTGVPADLILSPSRHREVVFARRLAMTAARQVTFRSYPELAEDFHRRRHSSVITACRAFGLLAKRGEPFNGVMPDDLLARVVTLVRESSPESGQP